MPKDYFSPDAAVSLRDISPAAKIHVIGVSGVAMAQLAVALAEAGYSVSGSDKEFYEPMGSYLRSSRVRLCEGYNASNVPSDVELVVIGNAVSYGHPEVDAVEQRKLPYSFFPKLLNELIIGSRHSVVVAGTHGKSTTTAMLASALTRLKRDPSYFVGGVTIDLPKSLYAGSGAISVVEGDEYDSAFFAKVPKFNFYRPDTFLITSIEYDHADIYPSLGSIESVFTDQVHRLSPQAVTVYCRDYDNLCRLTEQWKRSAKCRFISYGTEPGADYALAVLGTEGGAQNLRACGSDGAEFRWRLGVPGTHNALNSLAALIILKELGIDLSAATESLAKFQGVKRRQEIRFDDHGITVIEDFAHHPSAVRETIAAIKQAYSGRKLWAVFEPRSNTSRKKIFQRAYVEAFALAEQAVLCQVSARSNDSKDDLIDVSVLGDEIGRNGTPCRVLPDAESINKFLQENLRSGDVALIMSNGSFGGLIDMLVRELKSK